MKSEMADMHPLAQALFGKYMNSIGAAKIRTQINTPGQHAPVGFNRYVVIIDTESKTATIADDLLVGSAGDLEVTVSVSKFLEYLDDWAAAPPRSL